MYPDDDTFFAAFRAGAIEPSTFDHRAHLRAAACALVRLPFLEACIAVRDGLTRVAAKAGQPARYHETMTVAMLSLVADALDADDGDRAAGGGTFDVERFVARHPSLLDRDAVACRYRRDTFAGDAARRRFRLPDAEARPDGETATRPSPAESRPLRPAGVASGCTADPANGETVPR